MARLVGTDDAPPADPDDHSAKGRARRQLTAARARYEGSWLQAIAAQLNSLRVFDWTIIFGAELLWFHPGLPGPDCSPRAGATLT
jgi:hypothetical protein